MWDHRLTLVVAPAGSGKTTVLSQFATAGAADVPVAWYRAEPADASPAGLLAHLGQALRAALPSLPKTEWHDVDDLLAALEASAHPRTLLVIDDLHALWGTEAEASLERLVAFLPPTTSLLAGTRRLPGFDLSRLRVAGELLEISADDLRFRAWEVEQLFRDVYGTPMPPGELAELARRTEGWAAGLQLFHLATRDKPATDRRRLLRELGARSRILREYLTRNVLEDLPLHVREFLVGTSVLGRLTAPLCDELLGGSSATTLLRELEERQLFTTALDEDGAYRYHEVLRSHLEAQLLERVGEAAARAHYARAAGLLEAAGHLPEAVRAYSRAEDWEAVSRLLGGNGSQVIDGPSAWVDALPPALVEHDPWLLLARARRYVGLGRWDAALDAYERAAQAFGTGAAAADCQRERATLAAWLDSDAVGLPDWTGLLRQASRRDPLGVRHLAARAVEHRAHAALVGGLAALLAGEVRTANRVLSDAAEDESASAPVAAAATLGAGIARALAGENGAALLLDRASEQADAAGLPWLAGVARAALGLVPELVAPELAAVAAASKEDPWGSALSALFAGLGLVRTSSPDPAAAVTALRHAVEGFEQVGAPVLEVWARAALAAASPAALSDARAALGRARALGVPGASLLATVALVTADPRFAAEHRTASEQLTAETGLAVPMPAASPAASAGSAAPAALEITRFGELAVHRGAAPVDLAQVKPRVRSLLRLLALRAGAPVHREQLIDALWPDEGDVKAGLRNLQTAVSALRQLLEPGVARGEASVVVRDGDAYRLAIGPHDSVDVVAFEQAVAARDWNTALDLYAGDLFPDEGSAEWVVADRDRLRMAAADAAQGRADAALAAGDFTDAVSTAEHGLRLDGYRDGLWRVLIEACERSGAHAAAEQARRRYDKVLEDLGV